MQSRPGFAFIERATLIAARLDGAMQRGRVAATRALGAFLTNALAADEMSRLTIALYGLAPSRASTAGLDAWERDWYSGALPSPPARLLVTAAGTGREVAALRDMGYSVDAFEPAAGQAALIERGPNDVVLAATYDDLVSAAAGEASSPAAPLVRRRYDAVILGWGSFTHLLERQAQVAVLAACDALCPRGPILASFWPAVGSGGQGRSHAAGLLLGRRVARLRGVPETSAVQRPQPQIGFAFNVGFTRRFSREEIVSLAVEIGRDVALFDLYPYAHATLAPTS